MRTSRLLRATASVAVLILSVAAQSNSASVESDATGRCALTGRVLLPSGAPAASAVVVTSAGGQVGTQNDGSFELVIDVPRGAESVQLTAVAGSNSVATARVALSSPSGITEVGTLALAATTSCEPNWLPTFGPSTGTSAEVKCFSVFDDGSGPALYAGGLFTAAGGMNAAFIAKWNGIAWSSLGGATHFLNYYVDALAVFDDGSGPALYAGGEFTTVVGVPATSSIAKWNGVTWASVGGGMNDNVRALAVFDDGSGPKLYAAGQFTKAGGVPATYIAKWNGATWAPLGSGMNSFVWALTVFDDGSGPALYAGGIFTTAGGVAANRIAKWNGSTWAPLGSGINDTVSALAVYIDDSGPALYAGGTFATAGGVAASNVAKWNGAIWAPLGSGTNGSVAALTVFDGGGGPALYAGGQFTSAGGVTASNIARWNGATWAPLGSGIGSAPDQVDALTVFDGGTGPALYAGGQFITAGGAGASNIAAWTGTTWSSFGSGMNGDVLAIIGFDDGSGPALYAGGSFTIAGGVTANGIAKWDGVTWSTLGSGFGGVRAFAVFDDGTGPALYAGGGFTTTGGVTASVAKWNGSSWSALGSGMTAPGSSAGIAALAVFDDGSGPALYAGGFFTTAGGVAANSLAKWNGASWAPLGTGVIYSLGVAGLVNGLAVFDDGSGPALYAGGAFTSAGGVIADGIARWNGATWAPLGSGLLNGSGMSGRAESLTVFDDGSGPALYACGNFSFAGGVLAVGIAKWSGATWTPLGSGLPNLEALTVFDDGSGPALYAGGFFTTAGGVAANSLAKWNGASWAPVGGGMNNFVWALAVFDDGSGPALYVGGHVTNPAGDSYLAKWGCKLPAGARTYGASSPGCAGTLAMGVTSSPAVGNAAFAMTCSNTPASAPGAFFAGTAFMAPLPILGIQIWVSPIVSLGIASSASGTTAIPLPLPPDPMIAGVQFDVQTIWLGPNAPPPCPVNGLSASNALELTIQP